MERSNDAACWWHQAWVYVVAGGLIMGLALGIRHATGIFQVPITMSNGWTREAFGFTMPRNEEATPAALYVRREAGDSACDLYAPANPVTTFQEDV